MSRTIRCALIQASTPQDVEGVDAIKEAMIEKHLALLAEAADKGAKLVCLQELFYGPYFCAHATRPVQAAPITWRSWCAAFPTWE